MPTFTTGIFLLSSLAIVVPLALHLLHRKRPQPILFGAVRFLHDAVARSRRSRRLTQGLVLLFRCLILLLLALAFARPFLRGTSFLPEGHRRVLLVLDASGSMQAKEGESTLFHKGQQWLEKVVEELAEGDAVGLLIPREDGLTEVIPPVTDHGRILAILQDGACGDGAVNIPHAIWTALQKDGEKFKDFELHVFSDFQRGSWEEESVKELQQLLKKRGCAVFLNCPATAPVADAGVEQLRFVPTAIVDSGPYACTYQLKHTQAFTGSLTVKLMDGKVEQDQLTVTVPGGPLTDQLTGQAPEKITGEELTGQVRIDADCYALNDCRYYSLECLSGQPALVVNGSGDSRDSFFLRRALKPLESSFSYLEPVEKSWAGFLNVSDLSDYAMIFLCNPPQDNRTALDRLHQYAKQGGVVVLFPGNQNGVTGEMLDIMTGQKPAIQVESLEEPKPYQLVGKVESGNQLMRRLVKMLPPPWEQSIRQRLKIKTAGSPQSFIEFTDSEKTLNQDFMTRLKVGNGEVFLASVTANRDWSDWPLTPFYFVLFQELSRHGAGYRHTELSTTVGHEIAIPVKGAVGKVKTVKAVTGRGRSVELNGILNDNGKYLILNGFHEIGIYQVDLPWGERRQLAVNLPKGEISLEAWPREVMERSWFPGMPVAVSTHHEELKSRMAGVSRNHPLAPWLLLGAFLLSMIEVLYANVRSRQAQKPKMVESLLRHGGGVA